MSQAQGNRNGLHGENGATFEQSFGRLQEVVQKLSAGNLTLQEALSAFEEGMSLADSCTRMLEEAELRVKQVSARASSAGSQALNDLDASIKSAPLADAFPGSGPVIEVQSYERRVVYDSPAAPPLAPPRSPRENPASPGMGVRGAQQPPTGVPPRPGTAAASQAEDKYADSLDLDPLFDEEE